MESIWRIKGREFANCNCADGCPCQFNASPTYGDCRVAVGDLAEFHLDSNGVVRSWPTATPPRRVAGTACDRREIMNPNRMWAGVGLCLFAAVVLAATSVAAVISFQGGANPSAVVVIRFLGGGLVLYTLLLVSGAPARLAPRAMMIAFAIGAAQAIQSYALYSSLDRIPIGLTMIIFYVFPLMVGVLASAIGQDRLTGRLVAALIVAFFGLVLVFNFTGAGLDVSGALFAGLAAISWTIVVVFGTRLAAGGDSRPVTLHIQLSALVLFGLALAVTGEVRFPTAGAGWTALALIPFLYGAAMAAFFTATQIIGSVRTSLLMNFEAVSAILLGYLVLGQTLAPLQLAGAAIVIAALFVARRRAG